MIPELGLFALILALCFSFLQMAIPAGGFLLNRNRGDGAITADAFALRSAAPLASVVFLLILISFFMLVWIFLQDDFSVAYAARNSNSLLPWYYKISAVWGAHEGSMLLWVLMLSGWSFAVALRSRNLPPEVRAIVLAVQAALMVGFLWFILGTSSPFVRLLPFSPEEGADLNPLLQDFGLIIHPPMLYMGYVGMSVPFSFCMAALLLGRLDAAIARWMRPWTNTVWAFLTVGIALGSWWAYYELGWGGWWFWDPVENASLMPWLAGTALVHSLAVADKRNMFKRWTILLAITAFSLSLLGTFLVRSGILTSVHSFASDPERGVFLLLFFSVVVFCSLLLFAIRSMSMTRSDGFEMVSRETGLLVNNFLFVWMTFVVLFGTLVPLVFELFDLASISIGAPYFNKFVGIAFAPLLLLLAPGQSVQWKRDDLGKIFSRMLFPAVVAIIFAMAISFYLSGTFIVLIFIGALIAFWILAHQVQDIREKTKNASGVLSGLRKLTASFWGMHLAHMGMAVLVIGVLFNVSLSQQQDVRFAPGDEYLVDDYLFHLDRYQRVNGPNYIAEEAVVKVTRNGKLVANMFPQKRTYLASGQTMTEAGISGNIWRDLYVSMGEPLDEGAWAVRLYIKPFISWIWCGALFIALGAVLAVLDKRYRRSAEKHVREQGQNSEIVKNSEALAS